MHRILLDDDRRTKERQAVLVCVQPDDDVEIRCLDGSSTYEPITSEAYRLSRAKYAADY